MTNAELLIVLAEDNPGDVYLIREALSAGGGRVRLIVLADGESARDFFAAPNLDGERRPNLILLDLNLPRVDGRSVLRDVRGVAGLDQVPVVVLTSSESPRDRREVLELGADAFLQKPSNLDELTQLGPRLLEFARKARASGPPPR